MVRTTRPVECNDATELRLLEQLFVVEEKLLLTASVWQQTKVRQVTFTARGIVYKKLGVLCKGKTAKLEQERQAILSALE